jgi:hypothetical protein
VRLLRSGQIRRMGQIFLTKQKFLNLRVRYGPWLCLKEEL